MLHVIGGTEKVHPGSMRNITGQLYLGSRSHDNHNWLSPCRSPARAHRSDMTQWICIDSDSNRCTIHNHCGLQRAWQRLNPLYQHNAMGPWWFIRDSLGCLNYVLRPCEWTPLKYICPLILERGTALHQWVPDAYLQTDDRLPLFVLKYLSGATSWVAAFVARVSCGKLQCSINTKCFSNMYCLVCCTQRIASCIFMYKSSG